METFSSANTGGGIEMRGIAKSFAAPVLQDVSVAFAAGEIHALLGMNGAGKSTLVRILSGALRADAGDIHVNGRRRHFARPADALAAGIAMVYQELDLALHLTVAENLLLGAEPARAGVLHRRAERAQVQRLMADCGLALDPGRLVRTLRTGERQLVAIAKAYARARTALILDEPTSALNAAEVERLFALLRRLRAQGAALIYISHRLEEIGQVCDRLTVLRNGRVAFQAAAAQAAPGAEGAAAEVRPRQLPPSSAAAPVYDWPAVVRAMVGSEALAEEQAPPPAAPAASPVLLELRGATRRREFEAVDFEVRAGEVVALAGIAGDGRAALSEALFGLAPLDAGELRIAGQLVRLNRSAQAVAHGLGFIPEDRAQALCPQLDARTNATLAAVRHFAAWWRLRPARERALAAHCLAASGIAAEFAPRAARRLSGGTQQKLLFARWLAAGARLLILNEPTRGVDIAARMEIYRQIEARLAAGAGVLLISSDLDEILHLAHRVLVFGRGRLARELAGAQITRPAILLASSQGLTPAPVAWAPPQPHSPPL